MAVNNSGAGISTFQQFMQWFISLYDIQFDFFNTSVSLLNVIYFVVVSGVVIGVFRSVYDMTQR